MDSPVSSVLPLEDMYPFLDREEFAKEMIISPVEE